MTKLTIVANIIAKQDNVELIKSELLKLIDITRAEEGCLSYDLHQDNENPAHFLFFENWASRELWQVHMNTQHLADFVTATEGAIETFEVNEMTHIG
ncbi:putative quinol monooxygenase [Vibrio sp. B1Z05]|uniref:putative quinol monooxygenase n=1 Tax=Vibrio sp. B1Z05 TaxID=2654980 RepID=UPI00128BDE15|nr:putative quinol monooxygenase [Vibrio sp. B1Z05]MPW36673.1 antibiotic biosynthesis monooxygenase [Vibrio sp. B1Z05]